MIDDPPLTGGKKEARLKAWEKVGEEEDKEEEETKEAACGLSAGARVGGGEQSFPSCAHARSSSPPPPARFSQLLLGYTGPP